MTTDPNQLLLEVTALAREAGTRHPRGLCVVFQRPGKGGPLSADGSGPALREADPRRPQAHRAGDPGAVRGSGPGALFHAQELEPALGGRPARRHQGVRPAQRRVHGQHRARRQSPAGARHRPRARAGARLLRLRRRRRLSLGREGGGPPDPCREARRRARCAWSAAARTGAARSTASSRASARTSSWRSAAP